VQSYADRLDCWYPAIRFRKADDTYRALQAKEKGDWKKMTLEEKKTCMLLFVDELCILRLLFAVYRYSFRQTRAEFYAPMGYWKPVTALVLYMFGLGTIVFWATQKYGLLLLFSQ
jgi:cytochrome c oxidase subunit 4